MTSLVPPNINGKHQNFDKKFDTLLQKNILRPYYPFKITLIKIKFYFFSKWVQKQVNLNAAS